jgi:hypothetical protein
MHCRIIAVLYLTLVPAGRPAYDSADHQGREAARVWRERQLQSYSDNLQAARQTNHIRQPTTTRNLPVTIAAKTVTAANPHAD